MSKNPTALAAKSATDLTTAYSGWALDFDVQSVTRLVAHLTLANQTSTATVTLLISSSPDDGTTYYPIARVTSSGAASDGEVTWAVSADDTLAIPFSADGISKVRIEAKADAADGGASTDTLACVVTGATVQ